MDPIIGGALIAGGSSILGSLYGASSSKSINSAQIALANRQMQFQEDMSNTAHQREVKDLYAAGLNPILSAKYGGASTPSGSMATLDNPYEDLGSDVNSAVNSFLQAKMTNAQIENTNAQADYNSALTAKTKAETAILERGEAFDKERGITRSDSWQNKLLKTSVHGWKKIGEYSKYYWDKFKPKKQTRFKKY